MKTIETDDAIVTFDDSQETKEKVFQKLLEFFTKHGVYTEEALYQCDAPHNESPEMLADIASEMKFQIKWKDL